MSLPELLLASGSALLAAHSAYSNLLMLYTWEDQDKHERTRSSADFEPPRLRFTILLPARHEEQVIADTLQRIADLDYPSRLLQVLVILEAGDHGTASEVQRKLRELGNKGQHMRMLTFADPPINKPHGLNVGLREASGDIVTVFDAEDEPHPHILALINTVMLREQAEIVQSGVQLMNYADHWFCALNVLEYYFWFKSRMHYHAKAGSVPLGGNTVFIRRSLLLQAGGWDQDCLTEDADIGMRLSAAGVDARVIYDDRYVTREETPPTVGQLVRQRTRWDQGFLQVLAKGDWRRLPTARQRWVAVYILSFPLLQAITMLYLPFSIWLMAFQKVPVLVAMFSALPFYMVVMQLCINLAGLYEFTRVHKLRAFTWSALRMIVAYLPYQWILGYAALRSVWRLVLGANGWEKTSHVGAHRTTRFAPALSRLADADESARG